MSKPDIYTREFRIEKPEKPDDRTVEFSLSSEKPVERWFGNEILSHDQKHIRTERLQSGAPLLLNHNWDEQVGVVDSYRIEGGKIRVTARFSRAEKAEEIYQDVLDGIRKNVSVGYQIYDFTERGKDVLVTDWEPLEASIVSIPADISVGVGRSKLSKQEDSQMTDTIKPEVRQEDTAAPKGEVVDIQAVRNDARKAEIERIKEISAIGDAHGLRELAQQHAAQDTSIDGFRSLVLGEIAKRGGQNIKPATPREIGLSDKETRQFSIVKAIRALSNPQDRKAQEQAAFEFEASRATGEAMKKDVRGVMIPPEVFMRGQTVGSNPAGGYLVDTQMLPMIEKLENSMMIRRMGGRVLSGLVGDVAIPKHTGGATAYWIGEGEAATESQIAIGQLAMTPKTLSAWTDISRKLIQQSSMDVEMLVRDDLTTRLALAMDLAAINGSGTGKQPRGILNYTGIGSVAGGTNGAAPDWADMVDLEGEIATDNALMGSLGYLTNTKVVAKLKKTEKASSTGEFVMTGGIADGGFMQANGYRVGVSNQVPSNLVKGSSGAVCSAIIFGNWADLIIGMWGTLDITVDPYTNSTTGAVRIVVFEDCDIQLRHEESFAAMKDALTA